MPRDPRAYLADIMAACGAIQEATAPLNLELYQKNRLVRSSVEREFITIGEALSALSRADAELFSRITHARRIVDFRNQLTHAYPSIDDALVWAIVSRDVEPLRSACEALLRNLEA